MLTTEEFLNQPESYQKKVTCLYHKNCLDGFMSMVVAKTAVEKCGELFEYFPMAYGDEVPQSALECDRMYVLDFSLDPDFLKREDLPEIVILDHHLSAVEKYGMEGDHMLTPKTRVLLNQSKSGCVLTWEDFYGSNSFNELCLVVQDRDLWNFEMEETKAINAYLWSLDFDVYKWQDIFEPSSLSMNSQAYINHDIYEKGMIILYQQNAYVRQHLTESGDGLPICEYIKESFGHKVSFVNASVLQSDIGNAMLDKDSSTGIALVYYFKSDMSAKVSLRSRKSETIDVSKVAGLFGGGGHKNAAGFTLTPYMAKKLLTERNPVQEASD